MLVNDIAEAIPSSFDVKIEDGRLKVKDVELIQFDSLTYLLDGYSDYMELPKKYIFEDEAMVISLLAPVIMQAADGEPRI